MKNNFLIFIFYIISITVYSKAIIPVSISENSFETDFIGRVIIEKFDKKTITVKVIETIKGKNIANSICLNKSTRYYDINHRKEINYQIGQIELLFLSKTLDSYKIDAEFLIENDSVKVKPFSIDHGSFYDEYIGAEKISEYKLKKYSYVDLIKSIKYFGKKYHNIVKLIKKENGIIQIKLEQGHSFDVTKGPKIKIFNKRLIKIQQKSQAHKRLLDEAIEDVLTRAY